MGLVSRRIIYKGTGRYAFLRIIPKYKNFIMKLEDYNNNNNKNNSIFRAAQGNTNIVQEALRNFDLKKTLLDFIRL